MWTCDLHESQNSNIGNLIILVIYFNENACDFIDIGNLVSVGKMLILADYHFVVP